MSRDSHSCVFEYWFLFLCSDGRIKSVSRKQLGLQASIPAGIQQEVVVGVPRSHIFRIDLYVLRLTRRLLVQEC